MPSSSLRPIDLSDLDPHSPTGASPHADSPLFPTSTATATPSTSTSRSSVPVAPPPPPVTAIPALGLAKGEQDPLAGRLGRIQLGTTTTSSSSSSSKASSKASSRAPSPAPTTLAAVNAAQQLRSDRILTDLAREPFAAPSSLLMTDEPTSFATTMASSPQPVSVSSPPRRRPSRSGHHPTPGSNGTTSTTTTTSSFSPPRRLSSLMDFHSSATAAAATSHANEHAGVSSPPVESSAMADPFHATASSRPHEATRRIRQLSFSSSPPSHAHSWHSHGHSNTSPTSAGHHLDSSAEWGEFQDADVVNLAGSLAATMPTASSPSFGGPSSPTRSRPMPTTPAADSRSHHTLPSLPALPFSGSTLPAALGRAESLLPKPTANGFVASLFNSMGGSTSEPHDPPPPLAPARTDSGAQPNRAGRRQSQREQPPLQSRATAPPASTTATVKATTTPAAARSNTTSSSAFDPTAQPVRLVGLRPGVVRVLEEDVAEGIRPSLPPRLRLSHKWTLLYSLDQHGISLHTLFANLQRGLSDRDGGFVLVIKSDKGEVFGGYCSEALRDASSSSSGSSLNGGGGTARNGTSQRWTGDGSCFLWKSIPFSPTDFRIGSSIRTFKPTFRNTYYQYASPDFLAFGGGEDGVFGLWIDGVFEKGFTGRCETFANEPLVDLRKRGIGAAQEGGDGGGKAASIKGDGGGGGGAKVARGEEGKFEIVGFECWAVG